MNKLLKLLFGILLVFLFAGRAEASFTSIRLDQPESPTNRDTFNVVFVTLDTDKTKTISVQCYKKGPSDSGFVTLGSPISVPNGGNTGSCSVDSSIINQAGTYSFQAQAQGSVTVTSNSVSVDFRNTEGPGTPENYNKEKTGSCSYKISFRTANDSGKTVKVVLYRSDSSSFTLDNGTKVSELGIGSNTDGNMSNDVPDCNKTYYFAIRAFDTYGNGSGTVGDSSTNEVVVEPTGTQIAPAIAVAGEGQVLGTETSTKEKIAETSVTPTPEKGKEVLGEETASDKEKPSSKGILGSFSAKKAVGGFVLILALGALGYYFYKRNKS